MSTSQTPTNTSTSSHPSTSAPDATSASNAPEGGLAASAPPSSPEFSRLKIRLIKALRQFPDFPQKGVLFVDIFPLFADHAIHEDLVRALELFVKEKFPGKKIDTVVGLDARGFLFGPSLALRLGAGFAPVRKVGKLPGPLATAIYEKEYGKDEFAMQEDAIKKGSNVLIVDDIIATGGSAAAAGELVTKLGGSLVGYVFLEEVEFLKGRDKLNAPAHTLLLRPAEVTKEEQESRDSLDKLGRMNKQ